MIHTGRVKKSKKKVKINNIKEFKVLLEESGYAIKSVNKEDFKDKIESLLNLDREVAERLHICLNENIEYRAVDLADFIDYIEKMICFEFKHNMLSEKIIDIEKLRIDRIEFEREPLIQEDVHELLNDLNKIKIKVAEGMENYEIERLLEVEREINSDYLYAKDIEFLKKMIIANNCGIKETYNEEDQIKTLIIDKKRKIDFTYIKHKKGSIEYHDYLKNNIPRMDRLISNIDKYIDKDKKNNLFMINQSSALQDSINIAIANYDGKEFKAISGSNEIKSYCKSPKKEEAYFKSRKVNKLGKLGIGYDRANDSEKKIFEEIHRNIKEKKLNDYGELILYSKWEPCPSCYLVIDQFCKKHPNIDVKVRWSESYGEKRKYG
ncbi:deaminase domain-containing protein [Clostridium sp. B9]|uniref:deaminase domain-containing protein n=1 Tax=Clostridium sp. B9 TaxID=3423224 RepID=UPI003D2EA4ED